LKKSENLLFKLIENSKRNKETGLMIKYIRKLVKILMEEKEVNSVFCLNLIILLKILEELKEF
jgi:hypothetical protein